MVGAIPSLRCQAHRACAYPAVDVMDGKPACALYRVQTEHPEQYARRPLVFRRVEPAPLRRHYVAQVSGARCQVLVRCLICGAPCGPSGLCRAHIDGWRKHQAHHPGDQITTAQYAARRQK